MACVRLAAATLIAALGVVTPALAQVQIAAPLDGATVPAVAFGKKLSEQGVVREWIAGSRVRLEQLRLLVLKTAWLMDTVGNHGAHAEIQAIKIATPSTVEWILDKAIQVHGAGGLSQDLPLARMMASNRALRFADRPDEVHINALARTELRWQLAGRPRSRSL